MDEVRHELDNLTHRSSTPFCYREEDRTLTISVPQSVMLKDYHINDLSGVCVLACRNEGFFPPTYVVSFGNLLVAAVLSLARRFTVIRAKPF
jgi:hypothetical protein